MLCALEIMVRNSGGILSVPAEIFAGFLNFFRKINSVAFGFLAHDLHFVI